MKKIIKSWLIPIAVSLAIFVVIRPALAQTIAIPNPDTVGVESVGGYSQVYYESGENKKFITSGNINSKMPATSGSYVTYVSDINGFGQIFLYDVSAETTAQLTFSGMNLNPKVDRSGKVVWEGWSFQDNSWQIFLFDGKSIAQLTSGDLSLNPEISGDYITFGRKDVSETWRAILYSIKDKKTIDITVGENARNPKIKDGKIYLAAGTSVEEEFPLTVDDLFLLNLVPLSATSSASPSAVPSPEPTPETVTEEQITEELNASPSASPAETPVQESSSSGQLKAQ